MAESEDEDESSDIYEATSPEYSTSSKSEQWHTYNTQNSQQSCA